MGSCVMELKIVGVKIPEEVKETGRGFLVRFFLKSDTSKNFMHVWETRHARRRRSEAIWNQSFSLQCSWGHQLGEAPITSWQKQTIVFELQRVSKRKNPLAECLKARKSDIVAKAEISVMDLLCSPDGWFQLEALESGEENQETKAQQSIGFQLQLLLCKESCDSQGTLKMRRNLCGLNSELQRKIRNLDRDFCGCRGEFCKRVDQETLSPAL